MSLPTPSQSGSHLTCPRAMVYCWESAGMLMGGLLTTRSHFSDAASGEPGGKAGDACHLQLHMELCRYRGGSEVLLGVLLQRVTLSPVTPAWSTHSQTAVVGKWLRVKSKHRNGNTFVPSIWVRRRQTEA